MERQSSSQNLAVAFSVAFWFAFWAIPVLIMGVEQWPDVSFRDCLEWTKQGVVFTAAMIVVAEFFGKARRYFYLVAGLVVWLGAVLSIAFVATTGIRENVFTALTGIIYSTPDKAGLRYLMFSSRDVFGILAITVPFALLAWRWRSLTWRPSPQRLVIATSICIVITGAHWVWHDYGGGRINGAVKLRTLGSIVDPILPITAYLTIARALPLAREMMLLPNRPEPVVQPLDQRRPLTIVVIVGESTTRNHMSLYGYCRNTTPALKELAGSLFVFRNAISEVPLTVFALSNGFRVWLTGPHGGSNQSVFDVFNAAGFHTYWLSNQFDYPGDPVSSLTSRSQHQITTYRAATSTGHSSSFDEALLAPLDDVLTQDSSSKIILLHSIGTHSYYDERIPPNFQFDAFRNAPLNRDARRTAVIDAYDRAVRYVDLLISEVISHAGGRGGDIAVVYFSDHGDEVFSRIDFVGHRYPRATQDMVEIPLVAWLSPDLRTERPALADALTASLSKKLDMRDISALLFNIAGIEVEGLPDDRRPLGENFLPRKRLLGNTDYDLDPTLGIASVLPRLTCQSSAPR
jgi:glucan phosphoethanolaminetransferase (alkaline phosphatase superfamily)